MRKANPIGPNNEETKMIANYQKAIREMAQLIKPSQLEAVLRRLSYEPSPAEFFKAESMPALNSLWLEARIARERYLSKLADEVFRFLPPTTRT